MRLQVGRLRQKLSAYYVESPGDPVVVSLPKGAFKLNFEPSAVQEASLTLATSRRMLALTVALAIVSLWAIATSIALVKARSNSAGENWTPDLQELWGPFLQSKRPMAVCLGTPLFVRFPNLGFFRDPQVNEWAELDNSARLTGVRKALGDKDIIPSYHFTGAGEASASFLLAKLLAGHKKDLVLTRSNTLSWQQIVDEDVVFVGPPKFNLQLQAAAMKQDIVIEPAGIRNLKPRPGEPEFLADRIAPKLSAEGETHALISRTPGLSGVGELLVIGGNASADSLAAAEWLTQPVRAHELLRHLRSASGEVPRYFQAVIKVSFKQGVPVESSYVFHHVIEVRGKSAAGQK